MLPLSPVARAALSISSQLSQTPPAFSCAMSTAGLPRVVFYDGLTPQGASALARWPQPIIPAQHQLLNPSR